jgi:hypothetical protein
MEQSTPNLLEFVKRMKALYWPDWQQICETLAMNPEDIVVKEEPAPAAAEVPTEGTPVVITATTETATVVQTQEA